jgi:hypothetical protein
MDGHSRTANAEAAPTKPCDSGGSRWYVAQTLARGEVGAARQLETQGFRAFLPQMLKTVRHARQLRTVRMAVFPEYAGIDGARSMARSMCRVSSWTKTCLCPSSAGSWRR